MHAHSEYSLFDGLMTTKAYVAKLKEWGHTHAALTDHSNMHGAIEFYQACQQAGITPIIGCEVVLAESKELAEYIKSEELELPQQVGFHLVLLAKNLEGYKNLMKISSVGYMKDNLHKGIPLVPVDFLERYGSGLVALSGCQRGELGFLIQRLFSLSRLENPFEDSSAKVQMVLSLILDHKKRMAKCFGPSDYYIELIDNGLPGTSQFLDQLSLASEELKLPLVATCDAHYLSSSDKKVHSIAFAIKNSMTLRALGDGASKVDFHLLNEKEFLKRYLKWPQAIANTMEIARKCSHLKIKTGEFYLPKIDTGNKETPNEAIDRLAKLGLESRFENLTPLYGQSFDLEAQKIYWQRLDYELSVIKSMGFSDYFLIVQDFIGWAKKQGIPVGPGRGSGAGSLVAYALKITDLDPIPYNLLFERFLNPERISMPDFDVDFCQWRREEVIHYCINKYGANNVAQITTFGKMQAKGAVKSVGRALNLGFTKVDQFTKLFPPDLGITIQGALDKEPKLRQEMDKDDELAQCIEYALRLEGVVSHVSVHAAGLVISDGAMTDYVPVYTVDGKGYITQYEMKPTEKVGLVKFDFLGLKTLTVIDKAQQLVRQGKDKDFSIEKILLNDPKVFELMSAGHTCGIFQCESRGMTSLIVKLQPSCFEDVIALVALFRPGPLGSGMVDDFVERKHGRQKIVYLHPDLEPILKDTYGMILYQEQVQKIASVLAHYSLGEADLLRRAMGKKIPEEMAQQESRFLEGCIASGIDQRLALEIFHLMAEFAKYGFNKSHSAAYGLISYQTAYLKAHFPEEFMAAVMTCDLDNTDKIIRYIEDCQRMGFQLHTPKLNVSGLEFQSPSPKSILFPFLAVKGIGDSVVRPIISERQKHGRYESLEDFCKRVHLGSVGKKNLELLVSVGIFDEFGYSRQDLQKNLSDIFEASNQHFNSQKTGQASLFDFGEDYKQSGVSFIPEKLKKSSGILVDLKDLQEEKRLLGMFISGHPMDYYRLDARYLGTVQLGQLPSLMKKFENMTSKEKGKSTKQKISFVSYLSSKKFRRTQKGHMMGVLKFEDSQAHFECYVFEKNYAFELLPEEGSVVFVEAVLGSFMETSRLNIEKISSLEEIRLRTVRSIVLKANLSHKENDLEENFLIPFKKWFQKQETGQVELACELEFEKTLLTLSLPTKIRPTDLCIMRLGSITHWKAEYLFHQPA